MTIPQYVIDVANDLASKSGGSSDVYNALLKGYEMGNRDRQKNNGVLRPINDEYTFERWWNLYDKKTGREKCEVKWHNVLTKADRKAATEHTPSYVAMTPNVEFRKNPYTYLTQKCWKDEMVAAKPMEAKADTVKFMEYFNNLFEYTDIPKLSEMTEERTRLLNYIYNTYPKDILNVLEKVKESRHLTGEDGKGFVAYFEWIFTPKYFIQIKEGYYDQG